MFHDRTRKIWSFNTGDCLIDVTSWADLTVHTFYYIIYEVYIAIIHIYYKPCQCQSTVYWVNDTWGITTNKVMTHKQRYRPSHSNTNVDI